VTSTPVTDALGDLTKPGGALDLGPHRALLLARMLRLLAEGHPVDRDHVDLAIADLGIPKDQAHAQLEAWTERDEHGTIVGLGLTYNPTPHQLTIDGARMWAWCAMDTLVFPIALDKHVTIESTAPRTGERVRLQASPGGVSDPYPTGAVITWPVRHSQQIDFSPAPAIWGTFCHHSFFFPSRAIAELWAAGRADIEILSPDDGFAVAQSLAGALLRYEPPRR